MFIVLAMGYDDSGNAIRHTKNYGSQGEAIDFAEQMKKTEFIVKVRVWRTDLHTDCLNQVFNGQKWENR